ncbi:MAG TPA: hypothetical protein VGO64_00875 [Candidatus Limnocylindrales bacterium]|nr:hypothetical protein [Candidatus Limnocylindrales bacterium]
MTAETTTALGGARRVPAPDPIARDYLLLALRLDQHTPGLVDGYFGPADLKAIVDLEQLRSPSVLAADADALLARIGDEVFEPERRDWLIAQVVALRAQARVLAGARPSYLDYVRELFEWSPVRRDESMFDEAASAIDALLPGAAPLADRLAAWDDRFVIPGERLAGVVDWLVERFRARAATTFGLPPGEALTVRLVRGQPWSGYNWFSGGGQSRFDLNTDLPVRAADLVHVAAHEAYPGHHLEHATKEATLVDRLGRLEASILLINTPECLVSEGLADLGHEFASPLAEEPDLLLELYERAGLEITRDADAARDAAERTVALAPYRRTLAESRVNAALMRHADGRSHEEVLAWLEAVGRFSPPVAAKRLEFIEHPLWRTYVFVYHEGEALLRAWLDGGRDSSGATSGDAASGDRAERFGRLLRDQLSPATIAAQIGTAAG